MTNLFMEPQDEKRLSRMLAVKKGKPGLMIFDVADAAPSLYMPILDKVTERAGCKAAIIDASLLPRDFNLLFDSLERTAAEGINIVHLTGIGDWIESQNNGWGKLNWNRESFFKIPIILSLPMPPSSIKTMHEKAFDLYSWKTGIYELHLSPVSNCPDKPCKKSRTPIQPQLK